MTKQKEALHIIEKIMHVIAVIIIIATVVFCIAILCDVSFPEILVSNKSGIVIGGFLLSIMLDNVKGFAKLFLGYEEKDNDKEA